MSKNDDLRDRLDNLFSDAGQEDAGRQVESLLSTPEDMETHSDGEFNQILRKRVSELQCLNDIGHKIDEKPALPDFLQWLTERIPLAMGYPDVCVVAIDYHEQVFGVPEARELASKIVGGLRIEDEHAGWLHIAYTEERDFIDEESALLEAIVSRVNGYIGSQLQTVALQNARLYKRTQASLTEAEALYAGSAQIGSAKDPKKILQALVASTALKKLDRANILMFDRPWQDEQPGEMIVAAVWEASGQESLAPVGTIYPFERFPGFQVLDRDQVVVVEDIRTDERVDKNLRATFELLGMKSVVACPLKTGGEWIGIISGQSGSLLQLTKEEIRRINSLMDQAATVAQNLRLIEQTRIALAESDRQARNLAMLNQMATALNAAQNADDVLRIATHQSMKLFGGSNASIALLNADNNVLKLETTSGINAIALSEELPLEKTGAGRAVREMRILLLPQDAESDIYEDLQKMKHHGVQSTIHAPMIAGGRVAGSLTIGSDRADAFEHGGMELMAQVVALVASTYENRTLIKRIQDALQQANIFRQFADAAGQGIGLADMERKLIYTNQALATTVGFDSPDDLVGKLFFDYFPPEDLEYITQVVMSKLISAGGWTGELDMFSKKTGKRVPAINSIFYIKDEQGVPQYIANMVTNISKRRQVEEELRESQAQAQTLVEYAPDAIVVVDVDTGLFTDPNENAEKLYGLAREELIKVGPADMSPSVQPDGRLSVDAAGAYIGEALQGGTPVFEWMHRNASGEDILCEVRLVRMPVAGRTLVRASVMNITERKEAQAALSMMHAQTQAALKMSDQLYSSSKKVVEATAIDDVLQGVIEGTLLHNFNRANILIFNHPWDETMPEKGIIRGVWSRDGETPMFPLDSEMALAMIPGYALLDRDAPVFVSDIDEDERIDPTTHAVLSQIGKSLAIFPLLAADQWIGWLAAIGDHPVEISEQDLRQIDSLVSQASAVVQNLRLIEQVQLRARREQVLREITANVRGLIDPEEIMSTAGRNLGDFLGRKIFIRLANDGQASTEEEVKDKYQKILFGKLEVYSDLQTPMTEDELTLVEQVSAQVAQALESARLQNDMQERLRELTTLQRLMSREAWTAYQAQEFDRLGYHFDQVGIHPVQSENLPLILQSDQQQAAPPDENGKGSYLMPLSVAGEAIGAIGVRQDQGQTLSSEDAAFLEAVSEQVAQAMERARLMEQTQKAAVELQAVAEVSTATSTILDPAELLQSVVDLTKTNFGLYHAHIYLLDESRTNLTLTAGAGEVGREMTSEGWAIAIDDPDSLVAKSAREVKGQIISDIRQGSGFLPNPLLPDTMSEMAVPLVVGQNLLGVFDVQSDVVGRFGEEEIRTYSTLASQVAVALQNAQLYAEQLETVERLRELDNMKSAFLANMSHELRTPLNSILGFTQVILEGLDGPLTDLMMSDLGLIEKNGQHLLRLINDVLDMAKIEAGRLSISPEPVNLYDLFEEVIISSSSLAREKDLYVHMAAEPSELWTVTADHVRMRQIFVNLLGNSIKFTNIGGITIELERLWAAGGEDSDKVQIRLRDTGIGIPKDKMESVFEAFSQIDSSTTRKVGGTGLGLPISRRLVEVHGGRLWAESDGIPGDGSTFYLELPIDMGGAGVE